MGGFINASERQFSFLNLTLNQAIIMFIYVHETHQKFLGFAWKTEGKVCYFIFAVLPFGLLSACYAFTKLLRPLIRYW